MADDIERTLLVKSEVFVYKIPPRSSARGYRASDWDLAKPDWTARMRCIAKGRLCEMRLEDKNTGELFALCPIDTFPSTAIEAVTDSSRYFVICVQDSGRKAYIGMGFADRSDSFDLNVALQEHFKYIKRENEIAHETPEKQQPSLDLAFKTGQTIRVNIPRREKDETSSNATGRPKAQVSLGLSLPPPPAASASPAPRSAPSAPGAALLTPSSNVDLLGDLMPVSAASASSASAVADDDPWGDFASAPAANSVASGNWVEF